jgi:hypothetical protein
MKLKKNQVSGGLTTNRYTSPRRFSNPVWTEDHNNYIIIFSKDYPAMAATLSRIGMLTLPRADSRAEFCCPKPIHKQVKTSWFGDRSAYLASGRPVLAEDTGFSDYLPTRPGVAVLQ